MKRRQFILCWWDRRLGRAARRRSRLQTFDGSGCCRLSRRKHARWEKALLLGLRDAGWIDGRNLVIERRYAEGKLERLPGLADDLVRQKVEIMVTTVTADTQAAKNVAADIPVVMVAAAIPSRPDLSLAWRGRAETSPACRK